MLNDFQHTKKLNVVQSILWFFPPLTTFARWVPTAKDLLSSKYPCIAFFYLSLQFRFIKHLGERVP